MHSGDKAKPAMVTNDSQTELQPASGSLRPTISKAVTISDEPEHIGPSSHEGHSSNVSPSLMGSHSPRIHRASVSGKKLSGRPNIDRSGSSLSLAHQLTNLDLGPSSLEEGAVEDAPSDPHTLLAQVVSWLHDEKAKRSTPKSGDYEEHMSPEMPAESKSVSSGSAKTREELALEKLERILAGLTGSSRIVVPGLRHRSSKLGLRKGSIAKRMKRGSVAGVSSDTEYQDGDLLVPNVESILDNSKTMAYTGGSADSETAVVSQRKDKEQWAAFKQEIVRLTHTLRLKGWRSVPIEHGAEIDVERLSGALTNAVYVVSPPKKLPELENGDTTGPQRPQRKPKKLLLRVYGAQVEHLIDREKELAILRRLARKRIGPRMLGTFSNGRFEEFFNARTLTPEDLRMPDTSKQIAKRMRELHDGIELLQSELEEGPRVFLNWNQWVDRCEKIITFLDRQVLQHNSGENNKTLKRYTKQGLICGVEWPFFRKTVEKYQKHLWDVYGGKSEMRKHLVFAHNDTQYGNLMRLNPSGESPLLMPSNEHKQLVVIDFEYASPNTPGLEFANHFTEWCYNYHHPDKNYVCNVTMYPTAQEQYRFIRSYVMHRPQFNAAASATPKMEGREKTTISDFMLDARAPSGGTAIDYDAEERTREAKVEKDIQRLTNDTRLWRVANSAMWVAWGIVQAKVPELDERKKSKTATVVNAIKGRFQPQSDPLAPEVEELQEDAKHDRPESRVQEEAHEEGEDEAAEDDEFDYLAYAQDRAMFFWGDCLQMGFVKEEDLPEEIRARVKILKY